VPARIPACVIARLQRGKQFFRKLALCRFKGITHGLGHLWADEDISLRGPSFSLAVAGPLRSLWAGEGGDISVRVDDGYLAAVFARKRIFIEELFQDFWGGQSLPQKIDSARAIADIDVGLRGDGADARKHPRHHRTHREIARSNGDAQVAIRGVNGHDRKSRDASRADREVLIAAQGGGDKEQKARG